MMMRRSLALVAGVVTASALAASTAQAATTGASCNYGAYTQVFKPWGDQSYYDQVPTGSFESGDAPGWTLAGGASLASPGNTLIPYTRGYALSLPVGSSATTPPICTETGLPYIRMFGYAPVMNAKYPNSLQVQMLYIDASTGKQVVQTLASLKAAKSWAPTAKINLPKADSIKPDSTNHLWVQYRFTPLYSTSWTIDDLFIDPKKH